MAGRDGHEIVLARFGGSYSENGIDEYVAQVGARLVEVSSRPRDPWIFTVLNTPEVNAFALPGGFVYVTRGLLALANSEAELAGVLAHEISHVTSDHLRERRDIAARIGVDDTHETQLGGFISARDRVTEAHSHRGAEHIGELASYTRAQEFEADKLGILLMAKAGYDPNAQADFLDNLAELNLLSIAMSGDDHDPHRVSFFDSHPSTADRVREAIRQALDSGLPPGAITDRGELPYKTAIQGMLYGDSPAHGFVRGQQFLHPDLRVAFAVPDGFKITNLPDKVVARGPNDAIMIVDDIAEPIDRLESYIRDKWAPDLIRGKKAGYMYDLQTVQINGLPAATGFQPFEEDGVAKVAQLLVIRHGDRHYRVHNIGTAEDVTGGMAMEKAANTFRALSEDEALALRPYRIQVYRVRKGDNINMLSAAMSIRTNPEGRFRTLNDYDDGKVLMVGDLVKLVVE